MNEIDTILQKFQNIERGELLTLVSMLLDSWGNKCPESIVSLRKDIDTWCNNPLPFLFCLLKAHKEVAKSEEFFSLLSKVENYEYIDGNLRIMGLKVIGTDIKLDEYSETIPDENTEFHNLGYPIYEEWWNY